MKDQRYKTRAMIDDDLHAHHMKLFMDQVKVGVAIVFIVAMIVLAVI